MRITPCILYCFQMKLSLFWCEADIQIERDKKKCVSYWTHVSNCFPYWIRKTFRCDNQMNSVHAYKTASTKLIYLHWMWIANRMSVDAIPCRRLFCTNSFSNTILLLRQTRSRVRTRATAYRTNLQLRHWWYNLTP